VISGRALVDLVRLLPPAKRAALWAEIDKLGPDALADVAHDWDGFWARPDQVFAVEDLDRHGLIVITGRRGEGKTRTAVQLFIREIDEGRATRPRMFAAKEGDIDKAVVHGESGIITCLDPEQRRRWRWIQDEGPSGIVRVTNKLGDEVEIVGFTAKDPEGAVSHQGDLDLYDDVAKWGARAGEAWFHARASCRIGYACGIVATTRRGTTLLRKLLAGNVDGVLVRRLGMGSNAGNLAAKHAAQMRNELGDVEGDLLRQEMDDEDISSSSPFVGLDFDKPPIRLLEFARSDIAEAIVAVDPSDGKGGDHDEWGIGAASRRPDRHFVICEDASGSYDDDEGAEKALDLCERWGAHKIVVEANRGPRVANAIRAAWWRRVSEGRAHGGMPEILPVTARDGKVLRAGPVRPLYVSGLVHHLPGMRALEKQQREWDPDGPKRPRQDDRIDWLVHALHHLAGLGRTEDPWTARAVPMPAADAAPDPYRYGGASDDAYRYT
jgi:phage terminase large subunit-like protein